MGLEVYIFRERETGAECRVAARSYGEAHKHYKYIRAARDRWQAHYRKVNAEALRPFLENRRRRLEALHERMNSYGKPFDELSVFEMAGEQVDLREPRKRKNRKLDHTPHTHDGSVQLTLFD